MIAPIIIPSHSTREVNCIIEAGVRYCEKKDVETKDLAIGVLMLIVYVAWLIFWLYKLMEDDLNGYLGFVLIFLPIIVAALITLFI